MHQTRCILILFVIFGYTNISGSHFIKGYDKLKTQTDESAVHLRYNINFDLIIYIFTLFTYLIYECAIKCLHVWLA